MKKYIIIGVVIAVLVLLLSWGKLFGTRVPTAFWSDTQVACLPNGHTNLALHIHPNLKILVDGVPEVLPANIGISSSCMAGVHTHDATGKIHIESTEASKTFTLGDFFAVWGKLIEREGYTLIADMNSSIIESPADFIFEDGQNITFTYTSVATTTAQ